jgi:hypothetical protein
MTPKKGIEELKISMQKSYTCRVREAYPGIFMSSLKLIWEIVSQTGCSNLPSIRESDIAFFNSKKSGANP